MVRRQNEWPDVGELVLCTTSKVIQQGAFVKLDEYSGKEGFIHLSEIASKWVKNIRNFVKEDQKIVARVLRLNVKTNQIDLSRKRVSSSETRNKIQFSKREQKAEKLMELAAKKLKKDLDAAYNVVGFKLQDYYDDMYLAFEKAATKGRKPFEDAGISSDWIDTLVSISQSTIERPSVVIKEDVELTCLENEGLLRIKEIFKEVKSLSQNNGTSVDIYFIGSPKYRVEVTSEDYKTAEKALELVNTSLSKKMKKTKGTLSFKRLKK